MRPLPAPVRWAAVTVLTIAVSTGCMSVGDDGEQPPPTRTAGRPGASSEPEGAAVHGSGRTGSVGGGTRERSDRRAGQEPGPGSSGAVSSPTPQRSGAVREPGAPQPTPGGHLPTPEPSTEGPGEPPPPEATPEPSAPPAPTPEPEHSQPSEPSSASPVE